MLQTLINDCGKLSDPKGQLETDKTLQLSAFFRLCHTKFCTF